MIVASALDRLAPAEVATSLRDATVATAIRGTPAGASVAALTKIVLRSLVVARLRISAVAMLAIALFATGAWVVVRTAVAVQPPNRLDAARSAAAASQVPTSLVDRFGEVLPKGARLRMGTVRFRHGDGVSNALYTSQGHLVVSFGRRGPISARVDPFASGTRLQAGSSAKSAIRRPTSWRSRCHPMGARWRRAKNTAGSSSGTLRRGESSGGGTKSRTNMMCTLPSPPTVRAWPRVSTGTMKLPRRTRDSSESGIRPLAPSAGAGLAATGCPVTDLKFSPDGKTLATASVDTESSVMGEKPEKGSARIWDFATGVERQRFAVEGCNVRSVALSPDGKLLAASVTDGSMRIYDLTTGRERARRLVSENPHRPQPPGPGAVPIPPPALLPGQFGLVPAPAGGSVGDARPEAISTLKFSPDGSILAGGSRRAVKPGLSALAAIYLWDVSRGKELRHFPAHQGEINSVDFSPDGKTLVTTGGELVVRLWDVATGNERLPQEGHRSYILALAISPTDGTIFTAGQDGTVRRWDPLTGASSVSSPRSPGP